MSEANSREAVRRLYDFTRGYCGVREEDAGSELEIDHFQPRAAGGSDKLENLVYCCTTCNRLKGDFWARDEFSEARRLLHPKRDDMSLHLRQESDGHLTALTETGAFHLARLRLNRPPLLALRRERLENARLREELEQARAVQNDWRESLGILNKEIERTLEEVSRFLNDLDGE